MAKFITLPFWASEHEEVVFVESLDEKKFIQLLKLLLTELTTSDYSNDATRPPWSALLSRAEGSNDHGIQLGGLPWGFQQVFLIWRGLHQWSHHIFLPARTDKKVDYVDGLQEQRAPVAQQHDHQAWLIYVHLLVEILKTFHVEREAVIVQECVHVPHPRSCRDLQEIQKPDHSPTASCNEKYL